MTKIYKVINRETGKYWNGGKPDNFSKNGKIWTELRFINSAFKSSKRNHGMTMEDLKKLDLVEYDVTLNIRHTIIEDENKSKDKYRKSDKEKL